MEEEKIEKLVNKKVRKEMNKKVGLISGVFGALSATIGVIGTICVTCFSTCGGGCCVAGPLAVISGVGIAGFLHKYNIVFIIIGGLLFLLGVFLIILKKRKVSCGCPIFNGETKRNKIGGG